MAGCEKSPVEPASFAKLLSACLGPAKQLRHRQLGKGASFVLRRCLKISASAAIAQLGAGQTEDLKVPGSIPGLGIIPDVTGCRSEQKLITHEMTSCKREEEMEDCGVGV